MDNEALPYIKDQKFLITKRVILKQLTQELTAVQGWMLGQDDVFAHLKDTKPMGKVSRGENYKGLPYLMLDVPKVFKGKDTFSVRTLFWWGHEFSVTLHLSGIYQKAFAKSLVEKLSAFKKQEVYYCISHTPWEYHFGGDNYKKIDDMDEVSLTAFLEEHPFIKLSRKLPLEQHAEFTAFAKESFYLFLE